MTCVDESYGDIHRLDNVDPSMTQRFVEGNTHLANDDTLGGSRSINHNISATMVYLAAAMQDDDIRERTISENIPDVASWTAGNNILPTNDESMGGSKSEDVTLGGNQSPSNGISTTRACLATFIHDGDARERTTYEDIPGKVLRPVGNKILTTNGESMGGSKPTCTNHSTTGPAEQHDLEEGTMPTRNGNSHENVLLSKTSPTWPHGLPESIPNQLGT